MNQADNSSSGEESDSQGKFDRPWKNAADMERMIVGAAPGTDWKTTEATGGEDEDNGEEDEEAGM